MAIECSGLKIRSQIIWDRQIHGMGDLKRQFAPMFDTIWFATKPEFKFPNERPKSVLSFQRVTPEKAIHPTEKPIALMEYLVNAVSSEGDIILDPFMGGGSTGIASLKLKREFIGIELDTNYFNIAQSRINTIKSNTSLFDY